MSLNILETQIRMVLDKLSNGEPVEYEEEWIEEAGEMFKDTLRKQLSPREKDFRIRMSNVGRPLCQLQKEKSGAPKSKTPTTILFDSCSVMPLKYWSSCT